MHARGFAMAGPGRSAVRRSKDQLIAQALRDADHPLSAYELIERLRNHGINAPTTVYRALNRLVETGEVHRLESLNAFVCCARNCRHGTAVFAICEARGAVAEFDDDVIAKRLATWASAASFLVDRTTIELRGRCGSCGPAPVGAQVGTQL
jgi:Fur family zinc uptake transcriptional regulator